LSIGAYKHTLVNACIEALYGYLALALVLESRRIKCFDTLGFFCLQEDNPSPRPPICNCLKCVAGSRFLSPLHESTVLLKNSSLDHGIMPRSSTF